MQEFKADPDLFAARYFRLSREDYLEWIDLDGNALCSERDKSGQPCGCSGLHKIHKSCGQIVEATNG
jgi:hypothetical protein